MKIHAQLLSCLYCFKAYIDALWWGGALKITNIHMDVPVRVIGSRGIIELKGGVFGYRLAPSFGDGRILLQAREPSAKISIGKNAAFSNNVSIIARVSIVIGENFLCGDGVRIMDSDFHEVCPEERRSSFGKAMPVLIKDNVWIGSGVYILKGVSIGNHSVIAPGSIVTHDIPDRVVAGGVPAKVIKKI